MLTYSELKILLQTEFKTKHGKFNGKKPMADNVLHAIKFYTSFLDYDAPVTTRASYILLDVASQVTCANCNKPRHVFTALLFAQQYCSAKCNMTSSLTKNKRECTNLEKYGVTNLFKDTDKIQSAIFNKYGVTNPSKLSSVKNKISIANSNNATSRNQAANETNLKKYGVKWAVQSAIVRDKIASTMITKYGVATNFSRPDILEKINQTKLARWGTTNTSALPYVIEKIKKTKLKNHNDSAFNNVDKRLLTMVSRYGIHTSKMHWSQSTRDIMTNSNMLTEFITNKPIASAAIELQVSPTTLRNTANKHGIVTYSRRKNQYEDLIFNLLTEHTVVFEQNNRSVLQGKELDFYIPHLNLAIECNGMFWHSELMGKDRRYHVSKTEACATKGIRLLQFWDYQIDENWPVVASMILNAVGCTKIKIGARKTKLIQLTSAECSSFLSANHLQGSINASIRYGLTYNGELVSVMCFGGSRFKQGEYELLRFANKLNYQVVGGASKLLTAFLNDNPIITTVISYASRDISMGNMYTQIGFVEITKTSPAYMYFLNRIVYNRIKFQKHKLKDTLEIFDPNLSEWENMKNNGYNRFWNTGNIKYAYTRK